MSKSRFFTEQEAEAVRQAVVQAERRTSGEIRVYVESHCREDVLDRAAWMFHRWGMQNTRERTGVLIYIAVKSRKLAVIGDAGINAAVPSGFWNMAKDAMIEHLKEGRLCQAVVEGVSRVGDILHERFPRQEDDRNELPDDVICGK